MAYRELLIGCGSNKKKKIHSNSSDKWVNLTTLDINPDHKPDVIWDLEQFPYPFASDTFDEIHAYEVLEHTGQQGDYKFYFKQFSELARILKDGGLLFGSVPKPDSVWAWGDPSHKRVLPPESFVFLDQKTYEQVGKTNLSDFRYIWKDSFEIQFADYSEHCFFFILKVTKHAIHGQRTS